MADIKQKAQEFKEVILGMISAHERVPDGRAAKLIELGWQAYVYVGTESDVLRSRENIGKGYPKIIIHGVEKFPDEAKWFIDDNRDIHLALGGRDADAGLDDIGEELIDAFQNYYKSAKEKPEDHSRKNQRRGTASGISGGREVDELRSDRFGRRVGEFEYGVRNEYGVRRHGNTWGHVNDSKEEWFYAMNFTDPGGSEEVTLKTRAAYLSLIHQTQWKLLNQEFSDDWKVGDLLRHLRVRAGRSTNNAAEQLDSGQSGFSRGENKQISPLLSSSYKLLNLNFYRFPEVEGVVDSEYADKFVEKMGYKDFIFVHENSKEVFFEALSATIKFYLEQETDEKNSGLDAAGNKAERFIKSSLQQQRKEKGQRLTVTFSEIPAINYVVRYLAKGFKGIGASTTSEGMDLNLAKLIGRKKYPSLKELFDKEYPNHGLTDEQIGVMQNLPIVYGGKKEVLPQPFDRNHVFEVAKREASSIGEFLRSFRKADKLSLVDMGEKINVTKEAIRITEKAKYITSRKLANLIAENPYGLPTGEDGKVKDDVVEYMVALNKKGLEKRGESISRGHKNSARKKNAASESEGRG